MNSKRKVSKVDERMLRENEYIGRVLNERVKELDRLKGKFERKLQQEKEKFAVRHLSITSDFKERKVIRKRISLAFESRGHRAGEQDVTKSLSDPLLADKALKEVCDGSKMDCLFPPITQNGSRLSNHKRISTSFSEGVPAEHQRFPSNSPDSTRMPEDSLPKWQKDLIDESRREENKRMQSVCDSQTRYRSLESDNIQLRKENLSLDKVSSVYDNDGNRESLSNSSVTVVVENTSEKGPVTQNGEQNTRVENCVRKPRSRKQSNIAKTNQSNTGPNPDITEDTGNDMDNITSVNMVKNLTKQQRYNLEHKLTFLPPMGYKFRDDTKNDSNENNTDTKRIAKAKQRWLKAYNAAKANFKGKGPKVTESPIQELKSDESLTPESCTNDPRLLGLVSLLCQPNSLCTSSTNRA